MTVKNVAVNDSAVALKQDTPLTAIPAELLQKAESSIKKLYSRQVAESASFMSLAPRIQLQKDSRMPKFEMPGGDEEAELMATIVQWEDGAEYRRTDRDLSPECYSVGGIYGTLYGECATCPHNQWVDTRKECKDHVTLLLVIKGAEQDLYELRVPRTSLKAFNDFKETVTKEHGVTLPQVIVKLSLVSTESKISRFRWALIDFEIVEVIKDFNQATDIPFAIKVLEAIASTENIFVRTTAADSTSANATPETRAATVIQPAIEAEEADVVEVSGDDIPF